MDKDDTTDLSGTWLGSAMATTLPGYTGTKITSDDLNGTTFVITVKKNSDGKGIEVEKAMLLQRILNN